MKYDEKSRNITQLLFIYDGTDRKKTIQLVFRIISYRKKYKLLKFRKYLIRICLFNVNFSIIIY